MLCHRKYKQPLSVFIHTVTLKVIILLSSGGSHFMCALTWSRCYRQIALTWNMGMPGCVVRYSQECHVIQYCEISRYCSENNEFIKNSYGQNKPQHWLWLVRNISWNIWNIMYVQSNTTVRSWSGIHRKKLICRNSIVTMISWSQVGLEILVPTIGIYVEGPPSVNKEQ